MNSPKNADTAVKPFRIRQIEREEALEAKQKQEESKNKDFVQIRRSAMMMFVDLIGRSPVSAQVMIFMAQNMSRLNQISVPLNVLMEACQVSRATMQRALAVLKKDRWIEATRVGATNTYKINSNAFWAAANTYKLSNDVLTKPILQMDKLKAKPLISDSVESQAAATLKNFEGKNQVNKIIKRKVFPTIILEEEAPKKSKSVLKMSSHSYNTKKKQFF